MTAAAGAAVEAAIRLIIANKTAITEWVKERGDDCLFPFFSFSLSLLLVHKHTHSTFNRTHSAAAATWIASGNWLPPVLFG